MNLFENKIQILNDRNCSDDRSGRLENENV